MIYFFLCNYLTSFASTIMSFQFITAVSVLSWAAEPLWWFATAWTDSLAPALSCPLPMVTLSDPSALAVLQFDSPRRLFNPRKWQEVLGSPVCLALWQVVPLPNSSLLPWTSSTSSSFFCVYLKKGMEVLMSLQLRRKPQCDGEEGEGRTLEGGGALQQEGSKGNGAAFHLPKHHWGHGGVLQSLSKLKLFWESMLDLQCWQHKKCTLICKWLHFICKLLEKINVEPHKVAFS